jgi:hypothetical protein
MLIYGLKGASRRITRRLKGRGYVNYWSRHFSVTTLGRDHVESLAKTVSLNKVYDWFLYVVLTSYDATCHAPLKEC